jgi:1-deoxy-D-xylulose-5-phosphate reductoisomerase
MRRITVLGSTGSIGTNTLDVIRQNRESFQVFALAAGQNTARLLEQITEFRPSAVAVSSEAARARLLAALAQSNLPKAEWPDLQTGRQALVNIAVTPEVDFVMSSIVGIPGLEATYEAVRVGKRIGLANKEVLVAGGSLVMEAVRAGGAELIPVDSEHNGAHQCLRAGKRADAIRLILTASGGPFRDTPRADLASVTPEQALNHPTWKMGNRITIDSATLMNKGFEVIEACWLFDFSTAEVDVVVHPQSTVHAMVEYRDGSVIAQVCANDMRMPIQYAMTYPERWSAPVARLDWKQARSWQFSAPDYDRFPLLRLACQAHDAGGSATCILNASDEVAVEAFLQGKISFPSIAELVEETLQRTPNRQPRNIEDILAFDRQARAVCAGLVAERTGSAAARV